MGQKWVKNKSGWEWIGGKLWVHLKWTENKSRVSVNLVWLESKSKVMGGA